MSKLPRLSGGECVKALQKAGFYVKRQESSHIIVRRDEPFAQLVVPNHSELDRGTLRSIIRHSGLSVEEFVQLLH
jgi:predicted RNA binding protein YcfA (HicA-like mRNA interferase family)